VAAAREALGPRFAELHAFGLALAETEVVKIALLAASAVPLPGRAAGRSATSERRGGTHTLREDQVSELITEGLTSQEIAVRLGIAKRTADAHTEHIMTKLGVHSRAQVAAWVERNRAASLAGVCRGGRRAVGVRAGPLSGLAEVPLEELRELVVVDPVGHSYSLGSLFSSASHPGSAPERVTRWQDPGCLAPSWLRATRTTWSLTASST
jgi:DNA-binding CsgD family transcriptional regulator